MNAIQYAKGSRIEGKKRERLTISAASRYRRGKSIRTIAGELGRSYGFVHRLLAEADVPMRPRGGARKASTKRGAK